jgi:hypothetical protein
MAGRTVDDEFVFLPPIQKNTSIFRFFFALSPRFIDKHGNKQTGVVSYNSFQTLNIFE